MKLCQPRHGGFRELRGGRAGQLGATHVKSTWRWCLLGGWGIGSISFLMMPTLPADGTSSHS